LRLGTERPEKEIYKLVFSDLEKWNNQSLASKTGERMEAVC
jgi:hypothetical protein